MNTARLAQRKFRQLQIVGRFEDLIVSSGNGFEALKGKFMQHSGNLSPFNLCLCFAIVMWFFALLTRGFMPGLLLLPACMWILEELNLIPVVQQSGEHWWGAMFIISVCWPFCLLLSVALVSWIGKTLNGGAKVLLWFVMSTLLTLSLAYPVILPPMSDQLRAESEIKRSLETREMTQSSPPQVREDNVTEWNRPARPKLVPRHSTNGGQAVGGR